MLQLTGEQKKLFFRAVIIAGVLVLALLIYFLFFLYARVSVDVEPKNAVVMLDNASIPNSDGKASTRAKLGKHTIKVEADDYIGFKEEITLTRGKSYSKKITLAKAPEPTEIAGSAENAAIAGNEIFYQDGGDKLIYKALVEFSADEIKIKSKEAITAKPIDAERIIWSPTKELLLLKRGASVNLFDFKKYDFIHQAEVLFGNNIGDIAWAPDNSRIAYYYAPPTGERSLIFSDKTNQTIYRAANLAEMKIENPYLAFSPDSAWLAVIPRNQNYAENKIYLMNIYTKELKAVNDASNQKEAIFSADSKKIIYSTYSTDPNNPAHRDLSVINLDGSDNKSLNIAARATDLRYWNDPAKIFLLRSGNGGKLNLVDLASGGITDFYFKGQAQANISDIQPTDDKTGAIFISDGKLYYLKLASN